jgi:DNA modification methylase
LKYEDFLKSKILRHQPNGFDVPIEQLNPMLFDWQKVLVRWALFKGKAALFESCGLGKTPQQLEWAQWVCEKTRGNVLILAPLAVAAQTKREGVKFGIEVNICKEQSETIQGINITNYERLEKFDADSFVGIVLDESSILKSFTGKTKKRIIDAFRKTAYKLCCTATPSPNDHMELLNHSDFLDIMPSNEALSRWFINDTMNFGAYRLKGHAVNDFWRWVSSWAVCINKPSDIGFDDANFILPPLKTIIHKIKLPKHDFKDGNLFADVKILNATSLYREMRKTAPERCRVAADLANNSDEKWVIWCNTNYESDLLKKSIPDSVEVKGSMPSATKERLLLEFSKGLHRVMVSKPSLAGFGLNWQHVNNIAFVGLSYSFEQRYQAIRRCWRFGQKKQVNDHIILSPGEAQVFNVVKIKEGKHAEMEKNMANNISSYSTLSSDRLELSVDYQSETISGKDWEILIGDAVHEIKRIEDNSVHFQIFSPPFSSLYIYSDSLMDMGNSKDDDEFFKHFHFLIPELKRILLPGRLCAVHCKQLVNYKNAAGMSGLRDFRGEIIRAFLKHGWSFHSEVTIWKDPVIEMQRTKAQGLLHKQIKKDSSMSRQGLPDYLVIFRKWPDNGESSGPEPVNRPYGFMGYIGDNPPSVKNKTEGDEIYSIHVWQRYASPVWFDIQQTNVLNCKIARDNEDEKHICPLQLDVIRRAIHLWTNYNDIVFTPFAGIGSELYGAIDLGRRAIGIELKKSYAVHAAKFLREIESKPKQLELF